MEPDEESGEPPVFMVDIVTTPVDVSVGANVTWGLIVAAADSCSDVSAPEEAANWPFWMHEKLHFTSIVFLFDSVLKVTENDCTFTDDLSCVKIKTRLTLCDGAVACAVVPGASTISSVPKNTDTNPVANGMIALANAIAPLTLGCPTEAHSQKVSIAALLLP